MIRRRLPNRRPAMTHDVEVAGIAYTLTVGLDELGRAREVFLSAGKPGSHIDALLNDAAVAISVALQHGVTAEAMAVSIGKAGEPPEPISAIGAALALLAAYERGAS